MQSSLDNMKRRRADIFLEKARLKDHIRLLEDELTLYQREEHRALYGRSGFSLMSFTELKEKNFNLGERISFAENEVAKLQAMFDTIQSRIDAVEQMAAQNDPDLQPLRDAFEGVESLELVTDDSFHASTIRALGVYVAQIEGEVRALSTNDAQDDDEDYIRGVLPGAKFAFRVITGKTSPDMFAPREHTIGVNYVKANIFDQGEETLWNEIMSGVVLY
jgi:chaperonin cofactor prefoldin